MHRTVYNTIAVVLISALTVIVLWVALYIDAAVLHTHDTLIPFFSFRFFVPALILGAIVSLLWWYFLQNHVFKPIRRITSFTERLSEYGNELQRHEKIDHKYFPSLSRAIEHLTGRMIEDQQSFTRMEQVRSQFLGNVSHELRTPIFALQGFIETLLDGAVDDPEVNRKFLDRAFHQTVRLNNLLSDLIEISRIESGDMKLSLRYFDIDEFLRQLVSDMQPVAQQRSIVLAYTGDKKDADTQVLGDKKRLKQVFENLIENAVKYNVEGGSITVRLALRKKSARIDVIDTGIGIPEEHRTRVFERFYRVDKDRSRAIGGTGLGLAIVKHIVLAHKGTVEVSGTEGGGSTFTVTLHR